MNLEKQVEKKIDQQEKRTLHRINEESNRLEQKLISKIELLEKVNETNLSKSESQKDFKMEQIERVIDAKISSLMDQSHILFDSKLEQNTIRLKQLDDTLQLKRNEVKIYLETRIDNLVKSLDLSYEKIEKIKKELNEHLKDDMRRLKESDEKYYALKTKVDVLCSRINQLERQHYPDKYNNTNGQNDQNNPNDKE